MSGLADGSLWRCRATVRVIDNRGLMKLFIVCTRSAKVNRRSVDAPRIQRWRKGCCRACSACTTLVSLHWPEVDKGVESPCGAQKDHHVWDFLTFWSQFTAYDRGWGQRSTIIAVISVLCNYTHSITLTKGLFISRSLKFNPTLDGEKISPKVE